jgi:hypothetical protein
LAWELGRPTTVAPAFPIAYTCEMPNRDLGFMS